MWYFRNNISAASPTSDNNFASRFYWSSGWLEWLNYVTAINLMSQSNIYELIKKVPTMESNNGMMFVSLEQKDTAERNSYWEKGAASSEI